MPENGQEDTAAVLRDLAASLEAAVKRLEALSADLRDVAAGMGLLASLEERRGEVDRAIWGAYNGFAERLATILDLDSGSPGGSNTSDRPPSRPRRNRGGRPRASQRPR